MHRALRIQLAILTLASSTALAQDSIPAIREPRCAGIGVARGQIGEMCLGLWSYSRYLNQTALDTSYRDSFGNVKTIRRRNDLQNQKVNVFFRGWVYNPRLQYRIFIWTANTSLGDVGQVAIGTYLSYEAMYLRDSLGAPRLDRPRLTLGIGAQALPTTRSTQNTFPNWLKVDHRTIGDEFTRGSYTSGALIDGSLIEGLKYRVMLGNNISGLGVNAVEIDPIFNTLSAAVWWMPTTKEFGPGEGYGDFEHHERFATLLGLHYTSSTEDKESQAGSESIENVQIRLSDGTNVFTADAFAPGTQIARLRYRMFAADAALKYRGYSLETSYFLRRLDRFQVTGVVPVEDLTDYAIEAQASAMLKPAKLQLYVAGSQIFGQYGDPWDIGPGVNVFPFHKKSFRLNGQALYVSRTPVGYSAVPFPLGGTGFVFTFDVEVVF